MAYEISRDKCILRVFDDAFVFAFSGLLDYVLDFLVGGAFLSANHEVDDGDIKSRNAERETSVKVKGKS